MKMSEFDLWARKLLVFEETDDVDASLNGLQVGEMDVDVTKMAFAVDACMDSFRRALDEGAQTLFVHHGLFWGPALPLVGVLGERVRFLMKNDMSLYACHLPLDKHADLGNNARIAEVLKLSDVEPFGDYRGRKIGYKGRLESESDIESLIVRLFGDWDGRIDALRFGPNSIRTIGVISGGGTREVSQAIEQGLDLYITGDSSHNIYHECREAGMNVIFAGHYLSEVFGVRAMASAVAEGTDIETVFIDVPTGY